MDKVYIVTRGDYSDYRISGVFDKKELAEQYIHAFDKSTDFRIETYFLNPFKEELMNNYKPYFLRMDIKGLCKEINIKENDHGLENIINHGFDIKNNMYFECFAKDENHAIEIANDKRIELIELNKFK